MTPNPLIQILDVTHESGREQMQRVRASLALIEEIAQRHGVRALLISPHVGGGDPYDAIFAIRTHDDSYTAGRMSAFTAEVETATSINAQPLVHSPDNPYLQMLALEQPYTDLLGEKPVNQEEIHAQSGFRRNKTGGAPPPSPTMSA